MNDTDDLKPHLRPLFDRLRKQLALAIKLLDNGCYAGAIGAVDDCVVTAESIQFDEPEQPSKGEIN